MDSFARYHDDRFPAIIDQCFAASETFRSWWGAQAVSEMRPGPIDVRHPQPGDMAYTNDARPIGFRNARLLVDHVRFVAQRAAGRCNVDFAAEE